MRDQMTEWKDKIDEAIHEAYPRTGETRFPTDEACEKILVALGQLAALGPDGGFHKVDAYFGRYLASQSDLFAGEAVIAKAMVRRYRRQLDAELVAAALEEPVENRTGDEDDGERADRLKPLVPGAAEIMKLELAVAEPVTVPEIVTAALPPSQIAIPATPTDLMFRIMIPAGMADASGSRELTLERVRESVEVAMLGKKIRVCGQPFVLRASGFRVAVTANERACGVIVSTQAKPWCGGYRVEDVSQKILELVKQHVQVGVERADAELRGEWQAHGPAALSPNPVHPAAARKSAKAMRLTWNVKADRWELKAHTASQCEAAATAGMEYDPGVKRYVGPGYVANAFRELIADPAEVALLDGYMEAYRIGCATNLQRAASEPVTENHPPKRKRVHSKRAKTTSTKEELLLAAMRNFDGRISGHGAAGILCSGWSGALDVLLGLVNRGLLERCPDPTGQDCDQGWMWSLPAAREMEPAPVQDVTASALTLAPKRRRGRPSNAELGRREALSQVERNRLYRARKAASFAVTPPREVAQRLVAVRGARGQTTGALLAEALNAAGA